MAASSSAPSSDYAIPPLPYSVFQAAPKTEDTAAKRRRMRGKMKRYYYSESGKHEKSDDSDGKALEAFPSKSAAELNMPLGLSSSLIPSIRTWSAVLAMLLIPFFAFLTNIDLGGDSTAYGVFMPAAFVVLFATAFLSVLIRNVNHYLKDTIVHGIILSAVFLPIGLSNPKAFINASVLYLTAHLVAHAIDFHAEEDKRIFYVLAGVVFVTLSLAYLGYGVFELTEYNIFN